MSTPAIPAVNPADSASAIVPETPEISIQERLDHATGKELDTWRKTGDIPAVKVKPVESAPAEKKEITPTSEENELEDPPSSEASAPSLEVPAVNAADSATAKPQKKRNEEGRLKQLVDKTRELETNWAKDRELLRQLTEKLAGPASGIMPPSPAAEAAAAKPVDASAGKPEPQLGDVDPATKAPLFKTWGEYQAAWSKWVREEAVREARAAATDTLGKSRQDQQVADAEKVVGQVWAERITKAREKHADYDSVMQSAIQAKDANGKEVFFLPKGSAIDQFLMESDLGSEVLYYIAQNQDETKHIFERKSEGIFAMNPVRQIKELAKIEALLSAPVTPAPPKPSSSAPRIPQPLPPPPREIGARNAAPIDEADSALARGDTAGYMRAMNARELKARRG